MKKIKALIYREWILTKNHCIIGISVVAAIILMVMAFVFSFRYGTLKDVVAGDKNSIDMLRFMGESILVWVAIACSMSIVCDSTEIYKSDINSNWTRYSMTLPADNRIRAAAHTLFFIIKFTVAAVFVILIELLVSALFTDPWTGYTEAGFIAIISLVIMLIKEFFLGRAKDSISFKKQNKNISAAFMSLGIVAGILVGKLMASATDNKGSTSGDIVTFSLKDFALFKKYVSFRSHVQIFVPFVLIGMIALLYFISKNNYEKQRTL